MAMTRRANNNARVSKRKGSRKGSKRVSRKGKKSSRKGTKKRGMLARLMGKMRRGKKSSRKSKGRKNNNVAVLVPAKGGQRGGGPATSVEPIVDTSGIPGVMANAKAAYLSDGGDLGTIASLTKESVSNVNVGKGPKNYNVYYLKKSDAAIQAVRDALNKTQTDIEGFFPTA